MRSGYAPDDSRAHDAAGLQALEALFGLDPASPRVREWVPFLSELSRNALMRRIVIDTGVGSSSSDTARTTLAEANDAVIEIVAAGLGRVDDADLLAARPLMAKMFPAMVSRCRDVGPGGALERTRVQLDDELAGLEPVLTRAVVALNGGAPVVAIDEAQLAAANRRAASLPARADGQDAVRACDRTAATVRQRLQGPVVDAPVVLRGTLNACVDSIGQPHSCAAGGSPVYPLEALRASIVGSQLLHFSVDATGRLSRMRAS